MKRWTQRGLGDYSDDYTERFSLRNREKTRVKTHLCILFNSPYKEFFDKYQVKRLHEFSEALKDCDTYCFDWFDLQLLMLWEKSHNKPSVLLELNWENDPRIEREKVRRLMEKVTGKTLSEIFGGQIVNYAGQDSDVEGDPDGDVPF